MVLFRDDIKGYTDKTLSDAQMERIAKKLSNNLMNEWAQCLEIAVHDELN